MNPVNVLFETSDRTISSVDTTFMRHQISWLDQAEKLIGIEGSRGVGKTTLLLQYAATRSFKGSVLYASLDNIYFADNRLFDLADSFYKNGGELLLLDEVHHYPTWSVELKNIYDSLPGLKVVYTGSSLLHLTKGRTDLSRRSVNYTLPGLSLREFINLSAKTDFPAYELQDILDRHGQIAGKISGQIRPVKWFNDYLEFGFYPFFLQGTGNYQKKLNEVILHILETDLPYTTSIGYAQVQKLKQLLYVISESAPFKPNILKLSERTGISRNTLKDYLHRLDDALLIQLLYSSGKGISRFSKPEKIYLHHPNIMKALTGDLANRGTVRETFFFNQLSFVHSVNYTKQGDFLVDDRWTFEVGGKNKTKGQVVEVPDSFLALDEIERGHHNHIPLWLFGFLY